MIIPLVAKTNIKTFAISLSFLIQSSVMTGSEDESSLQPPHPEEDNEARD